MPSLGTSQAVERLGCRWWGRLQVAGGTEWWCWLESDSDYVEHLDEAHGGALMFEGG